MVDLNEYPVQADPATACAALDADIEKLLVAKGLSSISELGWERPSKLRLHIPMRARRGNSEDEFLLELGFSHYPTWPPSARFINPQTKEYDPGADLQWLPIIQGTNSIQTHKSYSNVQGLVSHGFICCSFTLDFYLQRHSLQPEDHWQACPRTFYATVHRIQTALRDHYKGRFSEQP